jgi:hypothetical protein
MKRATRPKAKKITRDPFALGRARYAALVRGVRKFAEGRVRILEKELATLELSAREGAVGYLRRAAKELHRLEKEIVRLEKKVEPPVRRRARSPGMRKARSAPAAVAAAVSA